MASGALKDYLGVGVIASRPATLTLATGVAGYWWATDTGTLSVWNGAAWANVGGGGGSLNVKDEGSSVVNPATALNFVGAGVTATSAGGGEATITIPGASGGAFALAASWVWSTSVNFVDFTGLGAYSELLVLAQGMIYPASWRTSIQLSDNNGASFYSASTDYVTVAATGAEAGSGAPGGIILASAATAAAQTAAARISGTNLSGCPKVFERLNQSPSLGVFRGSTNPINAVRVVPNNTGGAPTSAGSIYVFGR